MRRGRGQRNMKKTGTKPRKLQHEPTYYVGIQANGPASGGPDKHRDLADLVWKYFNEQITDILTDAYKDLGIWARNHLTKRNR